MPTTHDTIEIDSVAGLLEELETFDDQDMMLFRGQADDWPLLPKLARTNVLPRQDILASERAALEMFEQRSVPHLTVEPTCTIDWLALAQHHGMSTRMLDWTGNPLAAMWFAVKDPAEASRQAVVWAYKPTVADELTQAPDDPFKLDRTVVVKPRHVTQRIVAQNGYFTIHRYDTAAKCFTPLEDDPSITGDLTKLVVKRSAYSDSRWYLDRCGIGSSSLFPDLDGLASYVEWSAFRLPDED